MTMLRGLSASAADDARVEREKLFRLRSDRPTHRPRLVVVFDPTSSKSESKRKETICSTFIF